MFLFKGKLMPLTTIVFNLIATTLFATTATAQTPADAIYHGGHIITVDDKNPRAEALAIKDGKIIAVSTK